MKDITDSLGNRMKTYESVPKIHLEEKKPVVIRVDGKAFHTFLRGCRKPFDNYFHYCMSETVKFLCANVQNCKLGYTQSDEITLILLDDYKENTSTFFDNQVEKICSVTASMATLAFNKAISEVVNELETKVAEGLEDQAYLDMWKSKMFKAMFDSRCFNVPDRTEAYNCLVWRQQDARKNSITMVALSKFSTKQLDKKDGNTKIEMLKEQGVDWNSYDTYSKTGVVIKKEHYEKNGALRTRWVVDYDTPVFTDNKEYIFDLLDNSSNE